MITLRNKIGQMLIMGFNGTEIHDKSPVAQWLSADGLGGVLLFDQDVASGAHGKNLKDFAQIKHLTHQLQHYAKVSPKYEPIPLFISIDYEGGAVDRLAHIEEAPSTSKASELTSLTQQDLVEELTQMATTLQELGFNLNFAPVVDLNLNDRQGIIGALGRSFSAKAKDVTRLAKTFVDVFNRHGIACCYKHFPGHGSAIGDTHEGFVDVTDTFDTEELKPYKKLLGDTDKAVMIMTAHVINKHLDPQGLPATLSKTILTKLLRDSMGYDGVIISDDLQMHAIAQHYSLDESLKLTINAGADMLIFANQLGSISAPEVIDRIEHLVTHGSIDVQHIDNAYRRIIRLKQQI